MHLLLQVALEKCVDEQVVAHLVSGGVMVENLPNYKNIPIQNPGVDL